MQKMHGVGRGLLVLLGLGLWGCGAEPAGAPAPLGEIAAPVMLGYANLVYATYQDASAGVDALDSSVMALTSDPTELSLGAARSAWIAARAPYGSTEAFRFYGGPIDDTDGPEGRINAWPMDEAYVDYVEGDPNAGIINDPAGTPTLDEATLSALNEKGGEKNIADLISNARGIEDVYLGRHGSLDVNGLDEIVRTRDASLDARMQADLSAAIAALLAIEGNFDQAILGSDDAKGRKQMAAAIQALRKVTLTIVEIADVLGIQLNVEE